MSHAPSTRRQLRERDASSASSTTSSGSSNSSSSSSISGGGGGGGGVGMVGKIRTRLSTGTLIMNGTSTIKEKDVRALSVSLSSSPSSSSSPASDSAKNLTDTPGAGAKRRSSSSAEVAGAMKQRKITTCDGSGRDPFCWLCHKDDSCVSCHCQLCSRSYHLRCLLIASIPKDWVCSECEKVMEAECMDTQSKAMKQISTDTLCLLLRYALERMCQPGSEVFQKPPSAAELPMYYDVIVNPMDFSTLEKNIKKKEYGCTDAFLADAKWILHNCIIYNGSHHKLTAVARNVVKSCKHEVTEIEVCPQCYKHSCINGEANWFIEPCDPPHPLVWAKLKGYPFWPAKAMEEVGGGIDVRFFGAHDKSVVPVSHVFMLSKDPPTKMIKKRHEFTSAIDEMEVHIEMIRAKYGLFEYAPFRTPYDRGHVYMNYKLKGVNMKAAKRFKVAAHGRFVVKGKEPEKVSAVAKTASAVKSKYSSLACKKSTPTLTTTLTTPLTTTPTKLVLQPADQSELQLPSSPDTAEKAIQKALSDCGRTSASKSPFINPVVSVTDIIQRKIHQRLALEKNLPGTSAESSEESVDTVLLTTKLEAPAEEKRAGTRTVIKVEEGVEEVREKLAEEEKETKQVMILDKKSCASSGGSRGTRGFMTAYVEIVTARNRGERSELVDAAREAIRENKVRENAAERSDQGRDKNADVEIKTDDAGRKDEEESNVGTNLAKEVERSVTDKCPEQTCVKRLPDSPADTKTKDKLVNSSQEKSEDSATAPPSNAARKDIANVDKPVSESSKSSEAASSEDVARRTTPDRADAAAPQSPKPGSEVVTTTVSPQSGVEYRDSLLKTIEACKGKLGITHIEDMEEEEHMDVSDDDDEDDEEESVHTQEREADSEALAESQVSTDSQDSRMNSEMEADQTLDSEMSSQKKTDSSDNDSALDLSSVTSDLQGKSLDSEKDDTVSGLSSETQSSGGGGGVTERKETSQGSSEFEVSSISNDVGNLPCSLASGEDGDTRPTEESSSSRTPSVGALGPTEESGSSRTPSVGALGPAEESGSSRTPSVGALGPAEESGSSRTPSVGALGPAEESGSSRTPSVGALGPAEESGSSRTPSVGALGPTEESGSSRTRGVSVPGSENKGSDVDGKVLGADVSDVCEKDTSQSSSSSSSSSSHSNSAATATHSVPQRSHSDTTTTTNGKIAELSSVLDKAVEKCRGGKFVYKSKIPRDMVSSPELLKTLLNFSAQVSSSQNWESSTLRKEEKTAASDSASASTPSTSKTSTGTSSGSSQVNPITINDDDDDNNDDDEPSLLMEVESVDKDEEGDNMVIDLDREDSSDTEDWDYSNEPCIIPRFRYKKNSSRKRQAPVSAASGKKSAPASHTSLAKKQQGEGKKKKKKRKKKGDSPVHSPSKSSAFSEPCEMMICDVRSLSGTQHAWKEDGQKEAPSSSSRLPTLSSMLKQTPAQQQRSEQQQQAILQKQEQQRSEQQQRQPAMEQEQQRKKPQGQKQKQKQTAKPWYQGPGEGVLYQTLKHVQTRPPLVQHQTKQHQPKQQQQEVLVRHVQEQLQHTIQQSAAKQQPAIVRLQSPSLSTAAAAATAAAENAGQPLLLHHFRMPPTPPVEASQTSSNNTATTPSRSVHGPPPPPSSSSSSDAHGSGNNKDAASHGGHSGRSSSAERQLSEPGPPALTAAAVSLVNKYSQQIVGNMQLQLAEMSKELLASTVTEKGNQEDHLKEEKEVLQWKHEVQMAEVQHNHKLTIMEMKACWEAEMSKALADLKKKIAEDKEQAVNAAKKKQWCAQCWKEAMYYCCWNTSYCSYPCQQVHWAVHQVSCRQVLDAIIPTTTPTPTTATATVPPAATPPTSTVMVATSPSSGSGFVSLQPTAINKSVMVANDGVLTQAYKVQKPNTSTVNVMPGGDLWRNRLQQNVQFFPTQPMPVSTTQAMKLLGRPNHPPMQHHQQHQQHHQQQHHQHHPPLPRFQYLNNMGSPSSQPSFQPSSLIQVVGQRPLVNMNIPSSSMVFPIMPQPPPSSAVPTPTPAPALHK